MEIFIDSQEEFYYNLFTQEIIKTYFFVKNVKKII